MVVPPTDFVEEAGVLVFESVILHTLTDPADGWNNEDYQTQN